MTARRSPSSLPAWRDGRLPRLLAGPGDLGAVGHLVPLTLLLIAIVVGPMGWWRWFTLGLPRLPPGEAVWMAGPADLHVSPLGVYAPGMGGGSDGAAIERRLADVARRDDALGLVLAVTEDVPYARVLDVVEAARAAGVRRVFLAADVRYTPRAAP